MSEMALISEVTTQACLCVKWETYIPKNECCSSSTNFSWQCDEWFLRLCDEWPCLGLYLQCTRPRKTKSVVTVHVQTENGHNLPTWIRLVHPDYSWRIQLSEIRKSLPGFSLDWRLRFFVFLDDNSGPTLNHGAKNETEQSGLEVLAEDLKGLLEIGKHSDATLKCGERSFPVHQNILSARSEVFDAMFRTEMAEKNEGVVEIIDMSPYTLELLIHYAYTGSVAEPMTMDSAVPLYQAAHKYMMKSLCRLCAASMANRIEHDTVCNVLLLADKYEDSKLMAAAMSFTTIAEGFLASKLWNQFVDEHPQLALKVYRSYFVK